MRPGEHQLALDEVLAVGNRDGCPEGVGKPEEIARPILRSDRFTQGLVGGACVPEVADGCEELTSLADPPLGRFCPAHGCLDECYLHAVGRREPCASGGWDMSRPRRENRRQIARCGGGHARSSA